jgi:branched-chain amino acid transport system ATP-binding protein
MALLEVDDIIVRFGGLQALSEPSLECEPGRISGLIGPNGAGKTTLFNVITGLQAPVKGTVRLDGRDITTAKPHKRARLGIARTFQRLEVFGSLSARENVLVAAEMRKSWSKEKLDPGALADELIDRVGLRPVADEPVAALPTGTARLVELARALATKPQVLLLDEPSSGLNEEETDEMGVLLKQLAGDGLAVLLVEHDMPFVMETCDHIDVLDFGAIIARGTPAEIQANPVVQSAYLGAASVQTAEAVAHADAGGGA